MVSVGIVRADGRRAIEKALCATAVGRYDLCDGADRWLVGHERQGRICCRCSRGIVAVLLTIQHIVRRQRKEASTVPSDVLVGLLRAQDHDAARHRYRFFGDHIPSLTDVYVRQHVADAATAQRTVGVDLMLSSVRHTLLLGGAGAGKSALVAAVVADNARDALSGGRQKVFTVSVAAADLVGRTIPVALTRACLHDLKVEIPARVFEVPPVRGGRWRVLIDGIDEIVDPDPDPSALVAAQLDARTSDTTPASDH